MVCSENCNILSDWLVFKTASIDERWKKIRELRFCFSCLKGHIKLETITKSTYVA